MKRTGKSTTAGTGRGRKPRESSTTQGRAGAQAPQVAQTQAEATDSSPATGGPLPEESRSTSIPSRFMEAVKTGQPMAAIVEALEGAGIHPDDVRSMRFDERRRVLTIKTQDFAIRELVVRSG